MSIPPSRRPHGVTTVAISFLFGTAMSGLAAVSTPGGMRDPVLRIERRGRAAFTDLGATLRRNGRRLLVLSFATPSRDTAGVTGSGT